MVRLDFTFFEFGPLRDGDLTLESIKTTPAHSTRGWVPAYHFRMLSAYGEEIGSIRLRVADSEYITKYAGNVGYNVHSQHRGRRFAARAVRLLLPLARRHGLPEIWITCNPDNMPSRRTCEVLGAEF